jgi:plastocyanin
MISSCLINLPKGSNAFYYFMDTTAMNKIVSDEEWGETRKAFLHVCVCLKDSVKHMQGNTKTIMASSFAALLTWVMLSSIASVNPVPDTYINGIFSGQKIFGVLKESENRTDVTNETRRVALNGVAISFQSKVDPTLTAITMKISDEKTGFPLTHVDWVIKIRSPEGREIFKSSTVHSHLGTNEFSYNFLEPGKNTVSVMVASNGPKLLGVDYPPIGHTRIFKSADPMNSWKTDQAYFFGTRSAEFTINIPYSQQSNNNPLADTNNISNGEPGRVTIDDTSHLSSTRILDGSGSGTRIKLELSTIPETVIAGKPVTLVLKVRNASNDTLVTHSDALLVISKESGKLLQSAPPGSVVPINGAFHGHTGELGITTVFPSSGVHRIDTHVFSLPVVTNYEFGQVKTSFDLNVIDGNDGKAPSTDLLGSRTTNQSNVTTAIPISGGLNRVAIIGQDAPFYTPDNTTVKPGTTLTFRNHDAVVHTATATNDGPSAASPTPNAVFDTGLLSTGQEKQITFDKEGTFNYFCEVHPYMRGAVYVSN